MKVISRTSVMGYRDTIKKIPQIAQELGVATILEGGIQRSGNQVRVNVQLKRIWRSFMRPEERDPAYLWDMLELAREVEAML